MTSLRLGLYGTATWLCLIPITHAADELTPSPPPLPGLVGTDEALALPGLAPARNVAVEAENAPDPDAEDADSAEMNSDAINANPGLVGVLAEDPPKGLGEDEFAEIGESWNAWGEQTYALLVKLYDAEGTAITQTEAIRGLRIKLGTIDKALYDDKYAAIHNKLGDFRGRIARRLDLAEALFPIVQISGNTIRDDKLSVYMSDLGTAAAELKSDLSTVENGQKWVKYLRVEVAIQLAQDRNTADEAVELIDHVLEKIENLDDLSEEQATFLDRLTVKDYGAALALAKQAAEAKKPEDWSALLRTRAAELVKAVEDYESRVGSGDNVRAAYAAYRKLAPDNGDSVSPVMRTHYMNYNVRIIMTEQLMRRVINDNRSESGWINECLNDAKITGNQFTTSNVSVDVKPNSQQAAFIIVLDGNVKSNVNATTCIAKVRASGCANFHAEKDLTFDGHIFCTNPARVGANAGSNILDATTKCQWVPILGRIASNIAYDVADSKKGESNAYAVQKIRKEVSTRLNKEINEQFGKAADKLDSDFYQRLRDLEIYPETMVIDSSENFIQVRARVLETYELSGSPIPPHIDSPVEGLLAQVHESALSNSFERLDLAGQERTEEEVRKLLESRLTKLLGKEFKLLKPKTGEDKADGEDKDADDKNAELAPEPDAADDEEGMNDKDDENKNDGEKMTLLFDKVDPFRFGVGNGEIIAQFRAGVRRPDQDDIPTQIISVPLKVEVKDDKILITRGKVGVKPVERGANPGEQITRARVIIKSIERSIPETSDYPLDFEIPVEGKKLKLKLSELTAVDGWLTIRAY